MHCRKKLSSIARVQKCAYFWTHAIVYYTSRWREAKSRSQKVLLVNTRYFLRLAKSKSACTFGPAQSKKTSRDVARCYFRSKESKSTRTFGPAQHKKALHNLARTYIESRSKDLLNCKFLTKFVSFRENLRHYVHFFHFKFG